MPKLSTTVMTILLLGGSIISSFAEEQIRVPPHTLPGGIVIGGFLRPAHKIGYDWVPGQDSADGGWLPGHWRPLGPGPADKIWVPGRFHRGEWLPGRWIDSPRTGTWRAGHYNRYGRWIEGQVN